MFIHEISAGGALDPDPSRTILLASVKVALDVSRLGVSMDGQMHPPSSRARLARRRNLRACELKCFLFRLVAADDRIVEVEISFTVSADHFHIACGLDHLDDVDSVKSVHDEVAVTYGHLAFAEEFAEAVESSSVVISAHLEIPFRGNVS